VRLARALRSKALARAASRVPSRVFRWRPAVSAGGAGLGAPWVIPVIAPVTRGPSRDFADYEGMVMQQYSYSLLTGFPPGCLHLATDGVQAKTSGEINQYFVLAPTRPSGGVIEVVAWLPIQVKRDA
jgi:hypothetical protein